MGSERRSRCLRRHSRPGHRTHRPLLARLLQLSGAHRLAAAAELDWQSNLSFSGGFDLSVLLPRTKLRAGASAQHTERDFLGRRLRFTYLATGMPAHTRLPPDRIFTEETIGTSFSLEERTLQSDGYEGSLDVLGGYASVEVQAAEDVRVIAGLRFERSDQALSSGNATAVDSEAERESIDRADSSLLPTANIVYGLSEQMNLRGAYS